MRLKIDLLRLVFVLQLLFIGLLSFSQSTILDSTIHKKIQEHTDYIFNDLVKIRRDFHRYPEVSNEEKRTSEKIAKYLKDLGLEVKTGVGGYGVVGILKGTKKGKKIAWRADIDAMPSDVPDVVEFSSKNEGVRHICGHDVHMTIAIGIANVLARQKENLEGDVFFIFQPAEETYTGAQAMLKDGLFANIKPDEIYAAHVSPIPSNMISTRPEWLFSDYKTVKVSFKSSKDNEDIVNYTKQLLSSLQNVEENSAFFNPMSQLDPNIGLANPNTIFKDFITVQKDFYVKEEDNEIVVMIRLSASDQAQLDSIIPKINKSIKDSDYAHLLIDVRFTRERANVVNDPKLTLDAINSISSIYGKENVIRLYGAISDGRGDDFAYFQKQVPGVYFLLGASNYQTGIISMPHSPNFNLDEECIRTGVNYFSSLIIERLK